MALMTDDIQEKLIKLLVDEGLVSRGVIDRATKQSAKTNKPLLTVLEDIGEIDDELLTHAIAHVSGVPYVNLTASIIDQSILSLLPSDIAERFMAVPLAEVNNRLAVAMIDANNVQAVDYLANRIQRPLKVFMASEEVSVMFSTSIKPTCRPLTKRRRLLRPRLFNRQAISKLSFRIRRLAGH